MSGTGDGVGGTYTRVRSHKSQRIEICSGQAKSQFQRMRSQPPPTPGTISPQVPRIQIQIYHYTPICPRGKKQRKIIRRQAGTEARIRYPTCIHMCVHRRRMNQLPDRFNTSRENSQVSSSFSMTARPPNEMYAPRASALFIPSFHARPGNPGSR